ncbi:MAG TPA: hypothetical protein P5234_01525 [Thermoanaerobaculaceae bacterium]|nr:hypothetical protein [Thermoanaerobaculaceae bacterium]HRS14906.1 hypothetical protein [Thermoanaerobaculaceae bacterium]
MSWRWRAAVAAACVLWAGVALADYKKAYADALAAARSEDWKQVVALLRQAIAERPTEGERIRLYGTRFEIYLPHFYLGQALANSGDCAGALEELRISEEQGAIRSTDRYAELQRLRSRCQRALPEPTRPVAPPTPYLGTETRRAETEIERASELEKAVAELRRSAAAVFQERPALGARASHAANTLGSARNALIRGKAGASAAELVQAAALAGEAARELEAVQAEVAARQDELRQVAAADQVRLQAARQELANALKATENVGAGAAAARPEVRQALETFQRARARAAGLGTNASADELQAAKAELLNAEKSLRERLAAAAQGLDQPVPSSPPATPPATPAAQPTASATAPPLVRQAAERYLAADYQGVLDRLASASLAEPRAGAVAALLRAAAAWALFVEEGETGQARLRAAEADIRACRRLDPSIVPDPRFFPPGFVELFGRTR